MRKLCLLPLLLMFASLHAFGGNWYVNKAASGSNNGTDWTNAWNELNQINFSTVACGDTVWLAGGTYTTSLTLSKACTAGNVLLIRRVLSTDTLPVSAAGWNPAFDSQVLISNNNIDLEGSYFTIDGRQGNADGSVAFGIKVVLTGSGGGDGVDGATSHSISNITVTYVELYGPSCVMAGNCGGSGASGFNVAPSSNTVSNLTIDHMFIHQWGETIRTSNWSNCTIQYSWISDTHNDGSQHPDLMYSYPSTNMTWRFNRIWNSANDGIFHEFGGAVNLKFYDNIMYRIAGWSLAFKTGNTYGPVYIYNNIIENDGVYTGEGYSNSFLGSGGSYNLAPGSEIANNIFYQGNNQFSPNGSDYNAYSSGFTPSSETGAITFAPGNPLSAFNGWVNMGSSNPTAVDFHLTTAGQNLFAGHGKNLGSPYNVDMDGNTRPADGGWTMGPYESAATASVAPPSSLTAVVQ